MSFTVLHKIPAKVETAKALEHIEVQVVQVTNRAGENPTNRVEARVFVDGENGGYNGPTKSALVFTSQSQVHDLIAALLLGAEYLDRLEPGVAAAVPMKAEAVKAVSKRKPAAAAPKRGRRLACGPGPGGNIGTIR